MHVCTWCLLLQVYTILYTCAPVLYIIIRDTNLKQNMTHCHSGFGTWVNIHKAYGAKWSIIGRDIIGRDIIDPYSILHHVSSAASKDIKLIPPTGFHNNPVIFILDGNSTHYKYLEVIDLSRENGILLLYLPPDVVLKSVVGGGGGNTKHCLTIVVVTKNKRHICIVFQCNILIFITCLWRFGVFKQVGGEIAHCLHTRTHL